MKAGKLSLLVLSSFCLFAVQSHAAEGPTNSWTKPNSGSWEEPYWSLGGLPSSSQDAIMFTNSGWKALAIGAATTADYPDSLSIRQLEIGAPIDSMNQLLLNYAGLSVPLNIETDLILGTNASLVSYYSSLYASNFLLSGSATFAEQSAATFSNIVVGVSAAGNLTISNAGIHAASMVVGREQRGEVNQYDGSNLLDSGLTVNCSSTYKMSGGLLGVDSLTVADLDCPGWETPFVVTGGAMVVSNTIKLGRYPIALGEARGRFALNGGHLQAPRLEFENGVFTQDGGTNEIQIINMPSPAGFGWADFQLGGNGVLISDQVIIGSHSAGNFVQSGGVHTNTGSITIYDLAIAGRHAPQGTYALLAGLLSSPQIFLDAGTFRQQGGTNYVSRLIVDRTASFSLSGGMLSTSNSSLLSYGATNRDYLSSFVQTQAVHTAQNNLTVDGNYRLLSGSLGASNIFIAPDGKLLMTGGSVSNSGVFTMDNGAFLATGQNNNLGKLVIVARALSRFVDGPLVSTVDFQNGSTVLQFLDSHDVSSDWNGTLSITNWSGSTAGGGTDQLLVGNSEQGLTSSQLERIRFVNPEGMPAGTYPARILTSGEVVPSIPSSINFELSADQIVLAWQGNYELVTATNITGPYTPIPNATSPYTNSFGEPRRFFRLRSP